MDIKDYLFEHGFEVSDRTIRRDFEQIRNEFKIEIEYCENKNGYFINHNKSGDFEPFLHFFEIVNTAGILSESLKESADNMAYISFDKGGGLKRIDNLKPLLSAIRHNRKVEITHYSFTKDKNSHYIIQPYLLKEYQNRWYVIGLIGRSRSFTTFGIERIVHLKVLPETFTRDEDLDPRALFENTIGLVHSQSEPQRVVLSFTPAQGKYARTLPLHHSQTPIIDDENEYRVSLFVSPNYELIQQILKHGETVKVLEPESLRNEVKELLKRTLAQY